MITVTVQAWNGEKEMSLEAYVEQWTDQSREFLHLATTSEDYEDICEMQRKLKDLAVKRFFQLYEMQKQK